MSPNEQFLNGTPGDKLIIPVLLTVFVRSSAQSAGIPNTSTVTYGSTVLPLAPDALGFGNCWPLITYKCKSLTASLHKQNLTNTY